MELVMSLPPHPETLQSWQPAIDSSCATTAPPPIKLLRVATDENAVDTGEEMGLREARGSSMWPGFSTADCLRQNLKLLVKPTYQSCQ